MTALQESRVYKVHLISLATHTWIKDAFFQSCNSWQGGTLSCLVAVLYLFHVFLAVDSRLPAHSHHCTVFSVKLHLLFCCNSFSKSLVQGPGPPLPSFPTCPGSDRHLQTEQEVEVMGCKQLRRWNRLGKLFSSHMLLPA